METHLIYWAPEPLWNWTHSQYFCACFMWTTLCTNELKLKIFSMTTSMKTLMSPSMCVFFWNGCLSFVILFHKIAFFIGYICTRGAWWSNGNAALVMSCMPHRKAINHNRHKILGKSTSIGAERNRIHIILIVRYYKALRWIERTYSMHLPCTTFPVSVFGNCVIDCNRHDWPHASPLMFMFTCVHWTASD